MPLTETWHDVDGLEVDVVRWAAMPVGGSDAKA
jgi:hypothetical protein